jgi:hypothetical protein
MGQRAKARLSEFSTQVSLERFETIIERAISAQSDHRTQDER